MSLSLELVKVSVIKASKFGGQLAKGPNKTELRSTNVHNKAEPRSLRKIKPVFGLRLDLDEGVSCDQTVRDQLFPPVGRKCKITSLVGEIECAAEDLSSARNMFRPRRNAITKIDIGTRLITSQSSLFD